MKCAQTHYAKWTLVLFVFSSAYSLATTVLPTESAMCFTSALPCATSAGTAQLPEVNGIQGVKLFTGGPETLHLNVPDILPPTWGGFLVLKVVGDLSGSIPLGTVIPVSGAFTISGAPITDWFVAASLTPGPPNQPGPSCGQAFFSGAASGDVRFSGAITTFAGDPVWTNCPAGPAYLYLEFDVHGGQNFNDTVQIESASINFGSTDAPEPGTATMTALTGAALIALRRRMRPSPSPHW
jgi:hypothetical protein